MIGSDAHDFDYSPDDALIAVAATNREEFSSEGGRVRLIDARTGAIRSTAGFPNALYGLAWSAYGGALVTGDGMGTVSIFPRGDRLDEGSFKLVHTTLAFTMDFGNEGKVCVTGAGQPVHPLAPGEAIVWDPATWRQVARIEVPDNGIWSVSASPVSPALALGRFDGNLEIWDRADGRGVAETPRLPSAVVSLDASPEGRWLAASTGLYPKIAVFEDLTAPATDASQVFLLDESRTVHPLEGCAPGSSGAEVTFSPDGSSVAAVTSWLAENIMTHEAGQAEIALWGTEDRALRWTTSLDSPGGFSLAFDPTGETLFAADSNRLTSRDAKTGAVLRTAAIPVSIYGSSLVWSERAGGLLLGSIFAYRGLTTFVARDPLSAGVMVFDRELNRVASWDRFPGGTNVLSLSPDGASVAGGGYRELRFWRTEEGGAGVRGSGVEHTISALARTPDGKTLAAAGAKKFSETTTGAISFWNPETGVCRGTVDLPGFTVLSLAFSADGKRLHYGRSDGGIGTLDAADAS